MWGFHVFRTHVCILRPITLNSEQTIKQYPTICACPILAAVIMHPYYRHRDLFPSLGLSASTCMQSAKSALATLLYQFLRVLGM